MATLADVLKGNHDLYQKLVGAGFEMNKLAIDVLPGITTELQEKMQLTISQQARLNTLKQRLSAPPPPQGNPNMTLAVIISLVLIVVNLRKAAGVEVWVVMVLSSQAMLDLHAMIIGEYRRVVEHLAASGWLGAVIW
eukprot:CAMPEP_0202893948 /NCGR_PEP_ID=MMETSP1392-20130828/3423_1 /ASSEMBLY_ACC=CAM_ASM_000868 /TAXON_ID=225041 /ORGANISM="Chlamydomonas chlamydogama, Strain SAG 11-48b" /LENGTH=136 /DNA_ID=CAMNT_0049578461 /DNA_START=144 /DNA_END=551 /DNA_ORIENTATION=-